MSGAEPWTGSNMLGNVRSGLMFALAARPMLPVMMALRSVRMSPNRLLATTTSNASGLRTKSIAAASTSSDARLHVGVVLLDQRRTPRPTAPCRNTCALDLVIDVTFLRRLRRGLEGGAHDPFAAAAGEDGRSERRPRAACPGRVGRRRGRTRPRCSRGRPACRSSRRLGLGTSCRCSVRDPVAQGAWTPSNR